jgi:hypothetical protein
VRTLADLPRRVHASTGLAFPGRSPDGSYCPSTCSNRVSHGQNVLCGILVAIVVGFALWAIPLPNAEVQLSKPVAALRTGLAARPEPVDLDKLPSVPIGLVFQHTDGHADSCVRDALGEVPVLDHTTQVQVFDADRAKASDKRSSDLVQVVLPGIGDTSVNAGNLESLPTPASASLFSMCQNPLCLGQSAFSGPKMLRVWDALSVRERGKPRHAEINSDTRFCLWKLRELLVKAKSHEVATGAVLGYRDRTRFACELPAPTHTKPPDLGDCQVAVRSVPGESRCSVLGGLVSSLVLETRIVRSLLKEIGECRLEVSECLLCRNTAHLIQPRKLWIALELGPQRRRLMVPDLLAVAVGVTTQPQTPVVSKAHAPESSSKLLLLGRVRVESELVACLHIHTIYCVTAEVKWLNEKNGPSSTS